MTRKKVKLQWISNDSARKASLRKRRVSLVNKVKELSTLCGVEAAIVIYSPDEAEPAVWPSKPAAREMVKAFMEISELETCKKMVDQETYMKERVSRVQSQVRKQYKKNEEMGVSLVMNQIFQGRSVEELTIEELSSVSWWVAEKKKEVHKRVQILNQMAKQKVHRPPPPPPPPPPPQNRPLVFGQLVHLVQTERTGGGDGEVGSERWWLDDWFEEMMSQGGGCLNAAAVVPSMSDVGFVEKEIAPELMLSSSNLFH